MGILFDSSLKFNKQISSVVKSCFYQLRLLSKVKPFLSRKNLETAVHAFISCWLYYCNSLYFGISQTSISRLQLVQNAATRLLEGKQKYDHITPILMSLHWLPVKYMINLKILLFVYKALSNLAFQYFTDLLLPYALSRTYRACDLCLLIVARVQLKNHGDRAFATVGPKPWNSLPPFIRCAPSISIFKSYLKTYFFHPGL